MTLNWAIVSFVWALSSIWIACTLFSRQQAGRGLVFPGDLKTGHQANRLKDNRQAGQSSLLRRRLSYDWLASPGHNRLQDNRLGSLTPTAAHVVYSQRKDKPMIKWFEEVNDFIHKSIHIYHRSGSGETIFSAVVDLFVRHGRVSAHAKGRSIYSDGRTIMLISHGK